jgi:hypothetical protein
MGCTSFSVDLLVVTPDQLRKITLDLAKDCKNDGSVVWTLSFGLQERKKTTDPFADVVKLDVTIKPALNDKAEATATQGLDQPQSSAAMTAADSAKLFKQGKISKKSAQASAAKVIAVRSGS